MRYVLAVFVLLSIGMSGHALAGSKPLRLAQSQSAACLSNCNNQYVTCSNQCPVSGTVAQNQPDINAGQVVTLNRIDILQNNQPIQCRLNCTTQQQSCWATCR